LEQNNFHKDFKLNTTSFATIDELIMYAHHFSEEIQLFLEDWFSKNDTIRVTTSGSTGKPKSIQLKKELMINSALATGQYFDLKENTTALLCLPIAYIAGKMMLIRAITLGWHLDIIPSNSHPLKNSNKKYDFCAMVPLQVENSIHKLNQIKKLIVGGGVVSNQLQTKLQNLSTQVFATYGMTETITHIAVKKLNNFWLLHQIITKQPFKNKEITSQKNACNNAFYQVLPNVTIYKDKRNCLVIDAPKVSDEIICTNDVVHLISDKHFEWLGRFDNVINSGGIKLYPEKIEEKLSKIIENRFFVAGIPDEKLGEKLILVVEGNITSRISTSLNINSVEKSLITKVKNLNSLSKFEIPKEVYFIAAFVETETGKIQRKKTLDKLLY
jgi:O-succinylbenzoic acid--CoA ligase